MAKGTILIVEDEGGIREMLADAVRIAGYESITCSDGFEALKLIKQKSTSLIICDVNLPQLSGFDVLEKLRQQGDETPIIFLTARHEKRDVTQGLRLGADDYITKPFGLEELMLRIEAVLRRSGKALAPTPELLISCGPLQIDYSQFRVRIDDKEIPLSPTEFNLLHYLARNSNRVIRKEILLDEIWGIRFDTNTSVLDTYISYLRKKLHSQKFEPIKTVRGVGYKFECEL